VSVRLPRLDFSARASALLLALSALSGCYRFAFAQEPDTSRPTVTYTNHPATFLNGFIGTGVVDAHVYCPHPIRTELHVSAGDVLISLSTLLVYTPHTLEVVCPASEVPLQNTTAERAPRQPLAR
jgi:hypothetical protein